MGTFFDSLPDLDEWAAMSKSKQEQSVKRVAATILHHEPSPQDTSFYKDSDRGMSLAEWQDWIVDLLIEKHNKGLSDNQLRMIFAAEFDRRYGNGEVKGGKS